MQNAHTRHHLLKVISLLASRVISALGWWLSTDHCPASSPQRRRLSAAGPCEACPAFAGCGYLGSSCATWAAASRAAADSSSARGRRAAVRPQGEGA
eukprot:scaffold77372_cov55-Phaeocystis_antarctica.AAC.2